MAEKKRKRSVDAIKRRYGIDAFRRWGKTGGSPILLAHKYHKPVRGYRVTKS